MISNMLRFPLSMFDDGFDSWVFPQSRLVNRRSASLYPPFNVGVTDDRVDLYLFIAGIDPQSLDVVIEKNLLSVAGNRQLAEKDDKPGSHLRRERFEGKFKRVITLPEEVDTESVEANYNDGVLHISAAKPVVSKPRQVQISVH